MSSAPAVNAANQDQFIESNPINSCLFDWLPRYILSRNDVPAALKLILMVMYGALRKDCKVTFRVATLAARTGLSEPTVKRAIKKGRKLGLFITIETGRALRFRLIDQSNKLIHEVDQNDPSLIIEQKKDLKETTTAPKPKPKPNPKPKSPPASPAEIAVVAEINNIKKIIEPEISLNRNAIEKLIGVDYDHIRYAKNEAMKPGTKNTNGLFIYLCNEEMSPMEKLKNGLDTVAVPKNIDGNSVEMRKITCYNRNVSNLTCTSILGTAPVTKECLQFCPFYVQRMEQDLKLYQKICVEIVHETDKAFLVHPVDSLNEHWIPKRVIKKQESYGDDSFLLTIPMSFELKNI